MRTTPFLSLIMLVIALPVFAQTSGVIAPSYHFPQVRPPVHKTDQPLPLNLQTLRYHPEDIAHVTMAIYNDQNGSTPAASWDFGPRDQVVLFERLALLEPPTVATPDSYTTPRKYTSIELTFTRRDGRKIPRLAIFKNTAVIEGERQVWVDPENRLEKWLFSTAHSFEDRVFANMALNVQTFRDCAWAGNLVVDTTNPNQCILPDGTLFLKIDTEDTQADPKLTHYDACYKAKRPVLDEFPRKCVLPGGRVVVEPARLKKETPPAPIKKATPLAATPVTEVMVPASTPTALPQSDVPAPVTQAVSQQQKQTTKPTKTKPGPTSKKTTSAPMGDAKPTILPSVEVSTQNLHIATPSQPKTVEEIPLND